jgi:hypothetical protein
MVLARSRAPWCVQAASPLHESGTAEIHRLRLPCAYSESDLEAESISG